MGVALKGAKFGGKIETGLGETAADLKFAMIG